MRKPFKFFHHVIDHPDYSNEAREAWNPSSIIGTNQFKLVRSMKLLKPVLRRLNKRHYSGISQRVKDQTSKVEGLRLILLSTPQPASVAEEHRERETLQVLLKAEKKFYRQRSRVKWADVGDRNTAFYHRTVSQHTTRNQIHFLKDTEELSMVLLMR